MASLRDLLAEGATGGIGGFVGRSASFPFDTLKVKLATRREGSGGVGELVLSVLKEEGIAGFYRGLPFSSVEAMYQKFLYAFNFAALKVLYRRLTGRDAAMAATILCGYLGDLLCVPFSMPIEAMVVQLQSAPLDASRSAIIKKALFTYEGLSTSLKSGRAYFVLSLKSGFEFAIFDKLKNLILKARRDGGGPDLPPSSAFAVGAVSRAIATVLVYPYARGKAMAQAQLAPTALAAVRQVLRTDGFAALYWGLSMELSRGVLQAAVMFAVMEHLRAAIRALILPQGAK